LYEPSSNIIELGSWTFNKIQIKDKKQFEAYIENTEYPCNLWSATFAYIWAISQSKQRTVLWKIVDNMLVIFIHSYKDSLYLHCLPFGKGNAEKIMNVSLKCLKYCLDFNKQDYNKTSIKMINEAQLAFLKKSPDFGQYFKLVMWQGIERHYDVKKVSLLAGKDFANVRNRVNKFHKENPEAKTIRYKEADYDELIDLENKWKETSGRKYTNIFDGIYYKELIRHYKELDQIILVIKINGHIAGMIAGCELLHKQAWGSVVKFESGIQGLSETLVVEFTKELAKINPETEFLNVGSDLGPGGLRAYKLKFNPVLNFKRYQIYLKEVTR
jgi:hypothetical protein